MSDKTFQDGLIEGEIKALAQISNNHKERLDHHSARIRMLERIMWILCGALGLIELAPRLLDLGKLLAAANQ
ncbi:MAG: hypothetical protein AAF441_21990 [Pseudomonadota bacterium]